MNRIIVDLDNTLTAGTGSYMDLAPNHALVARLREYRMRGFDIVVHTSRGMRSCEGQVGRINVDVLPGIILWLKSHDIPFDEVIVAKPWCGYNGFYIDDRAIRPAEFVEHSYEHIVTRLIEAK